MMELEGKLTISRLLKVGLVVFIWLTIPVIGAMETPVVSPIIVVFGHSEAERVFVSEFVSEFPSSIVLEYGSIEQLLYLPRAVSEVVYVGHGSGKGIACNGHVIPWSVIATLVLAVPSHRQYIAACHSYKASVLASAKRPSSYIVGFDGEIDSKFTSYAIESLIWFSRGEKERGMEKFQDAMNLKVKRVLNQQESEPILPLGLAALDLPPPFAEGISLVYGLWNGKPTLGGGVGTWSPDSICAIAGSNLLIDPIGENFQASLWTCDIVIASARWIAWATGNWNWDPLVSYITGLPEEQRFMLAGPSLTATIILMALGIMISAILSLLDVPSTVLSLIAGLVNFFISIAAYYIPVVNVWLNAPGPHQIALLLMNMLDYGSIAHTLLIFDICN